MVLYDSASSNYGESVCGGLIVKTFIHTLYQDGDTVYQLLLKLGCDGDGGISNGLDLMWEYFYIHIMKLAVIHPHLTNELQMYLVGGVYSPSGDKSEETFELLRACIETVMTYFDGEKVDISV